MKLLGKGRKDSLAYLLHTEKNSENPFLMQIRNATSTTRNCVADERSSDLGEEVKGTTEYRHVVRSQRVMTLASPGEK